MNQSRLYPLVTNMSRILQKPCFYSRTSFNPGTIKDEKARGNIKTFREILVNRRWQKKRFSLILPRSSESLCNGREMKLENSIRSSYEILGCGMILLKNYISLDDQVDIVNKCQQLGFDATGFRECIPDGEKLGIQMMLLGLKWYPPSFHVDKPSVLKPLTVPDKIISLVKSSIQDSQQYLNSKDEISSVCSNHCIVKFYTNTDPLALHEERNDNSWYPYGTKGLPVVSISIGDSAEFFYGNSRNVNEGNKVLMESGDVLIFSNTSRDTFHELHKIIPNSAPVSFSRKSMLKPGLLHLSFREF